MIRLEHVAADLVTPADVRLRSVGGVCFGFTFLQLGLVESGLQLLECRCAILVLRTLVLAGDHDPGGNVRDPDGAVGCVDVLPACPTSPIGVDPQIGFVDLDIDIVIHFGIDPHAGKARVSPGIRVIRADPDKPVDAALNLQIAVGILAFHQDRRRLDPRLLASMVVDHLDLVSVALAPPGIHAEQHFRPVLALGSARARVHFNVAAVRVRLAGQESRDLVAFRALGKVAETAHGVIRQCRIALQLRQLHQLDRVAELALDRPGRVDGLLEPPTLAHHLLRRLGIVPERRVLNLGVKLIQALQRTIPVEEPAQQRQGGIDLVDMGLRFGAHLNVLSLDG